MDVSSLSKHNNGVNSLLSVIDVFSPKVFVRALKTKRSVDVAKAFVHFMMLARDSHSSCRPIMEKNLWANFLIKCSKA